MLLSQGKLPSWAPAEPDGSSQFKPLKKQFQWQYLSTPDGDDTGLEKRSQHDNLCTFISVAPLELLFYPSSPINVPKKTGPLSYHLLKRKLPVVAKKLDELQKVWVLEHLLQAIKKGCEKHCQISNVSERHKHTQWRSFGSCCVAVLIAVHACTRSPLHYSKEGDVRRALEEELKDLP